MTMVKEKPAGQNGAGFIQFDRKWRLIPSPPKNLVF